MVPGAWPHAGGGGGWLGLFSSLFAQPWGRPVVRIKAGVPQGSQLSGSSEGRERGSRPGAFPTVEGATMPALPSLKRRQSQPTQA